MVKIGVTVYFCFEDFETRLFLFSLNLFQIMRTEESTCINQTTVAWKISK